MHGNVGLKKGDHLRIFVRFYGKKTQLEWYYYTIAILTVQFSTSGGHFLAWTPPLLYARCSFKLTERQSRPEVEERIKYAECRGGSRYNFFFFNNKIIL